jgi:nucleoid DNA-binding protein
MQEEINLPELIDQAAEEVGIHPESAKRAIMKFLELIDEYAAKGHRVELHQIGTFKYKRRKGKTVTGFDKGQHVIPATRRLVFKAAAAKVFTIVE